MRWGYIQKGARPTKRAKEITSKERKKHKVYQVVKKV